MTPELRLEPTPDSPRLAREFVARTLTSWDLDDLELEASLLVTELVTNAVIHARTTVLLRLSRVDDQLRVEVVDGSARPPVRRHNARDSTTGRGIALVEHLAAAWGVETGSAGKSVWFSLSCAGGASKGWTVEIDGLFDDAAAVPSPRRQDDPAPDLNGSSPVEPDRATGCAYLRRCA